MNKTKIELIKNINEIKSVAELIIKICSDNKEQFILLKGQIGSGKTTLVKEIGKLLGENKDIISPTFNKMFVYDLFVHIDAYNFKDESLNDWDEYFDDKFIIIEWFENIKNLDLKGLIVNIQFVNENNRKYILEWKE